MNVRCIWQRGRYLYIGYNRFLLQQLKSNQHAERNNSLSWDQSQHSLLCSYQTLNYLADNSWKPQNRHFASSPQRYLIKDKKSAAVKQITELLETNEENVRKKMASLRSYYCRLRSQYKGAKTKSGSGTADIKKATWPFFDSLKF